MTTPSGRPGFSVIDRFGITGDDGSVPDLVNRTQEVITGVLKERMKASPGWNGSTAAVWNNLRRGIPLDHALLEVIVNRLTGGLVTFPTKQDAIMALQKVPGIGDLVELLTGIEDGDENDLGTWALNIRNFFGNIDFTDPDFDVEAAFQEFVSTVVQPLIKITDRLRGLIDISWLTNEHQNLVDEPGYDDPIAVVSPDDPKITHDATDGVPGSTPLGCLKFECDGANHERAGDMIKVGKGWELTPESAVKWQGITATAAANAIRLELQPYFLAGTVATPVGGRVLVGAVASPAGSSGGAGGWGTKITGSYTVPSDGSVSHVVLFPRVTGAATAGVAKFDNTNLFATQDIPQEFVKDLLADLQSLLDWLTAWVENGLAALGVTPIGSLFDKINDLADAISEVQDNAESAFAGLADKLGIDTWDDWLAAQWTVLKNALLTNPGTVIGNLTQDLVEGLEDDLADAGDAIADVFDDVRDGWNRLWDGAFKTTGSTGKTAADVQAAAAEMINTATAAHVSIETANAAVATWQSAFTQQQMAQPLWLTGTDGTCEVTIPLAWCHYWPDPADGGHNSFALSCGVGSHTHAVDTIPIAIEEFKVSAIMAGINGPGQFVGGVMRCRGGDLKDTITTHGLMTEGCRFVIFEMNVTDGSVKLLYESANLPFSGSLSGVPIVHEMPAGSEFITTVGQVLVVGVWAPVDALAVLAGAPISQGFSSASSAFPKSIGVRDTGWSTNAPTTMSNGDFTYMTFETSSYADLEAATVPFFGLGSASPPAPVLRRRFVSQFATTGVADWVNVTGPFGTINGELSSTALAAGVYKDPLAADSPTAEIHLSPTRTLGKTRIAVKSNADMSKWIGVEFDRTSNTVMTAKIVTGTGPNSGLTTRFTSANVGSLSDIGPYEPDPITGETRVGGPRFRISYDQASNTYEMFKLSPFWTWDSLGTWVDSGGFTAHGPEHRYGGAVTGVNGSPNRGQPVTQVSFFDS